MENLSVLNSSRTDIAATFLLNDIRGAGIPGSRLGVILDRAIARHPLSVLQQDFLRQHGYEALLQFALGELNMEAYCKRARGEQEVRLRASVAVKNKEAIENARKAEATDRKNAALIAEGERKLERRRKLRELPDRFGQPIIDRSDRGRVNPILRSVADGQPIKKFDLVWLGTDGRKYWSAELRKAHHENIAKILSDEWIQTKDVWKAINACGHWRKAGDSEKGLAIAEEALDQAAKTSKPRSALLTTGGGALRDLSRLHDAVRFGEEAHFLTPEDFRPCTLLGAVHIEMGAHDTGAEWYEKAEARGASRNLIDQELQSILNAAAPKERNQIIKALKARDASRYDWL
jgi:hypothetical protein